MFNKKVGEGVAKNTEKIDEIWEVIEEMQKNLDFLNDKVQRLITRVGIE